MIKIVDLQKKSIQWLVIYIYQLNSIFVFNKIFLFVNLVLDSVQDKYIQEEIIFVNYF